TSQIAGAPDASWWLGIVNGEGAAVACGQVQPASGTTSGTPLPGTTLPSSTATPISTPGSVMTVTPTIPSGSPADYPTVTPTSAPTGVTVPVVTPTPFPAASGTPHPPPGS